MIFIYAGIMTSAAVFGIGVVIWCREEIKKIEKEEAKRHAYQNRRKRNN